MARVWHSVTTKYIFNDVLQLQAFSWRTKMATI